MTEKNMILNSIKEHEKEIKNFGIDKLGLFGSFVRGEQQEDSDIDFLYEFEEGKATLRNLIQLKSFLENLLEHRTDLVSKKFLSPHIEPKILKEVEFIIK